MIGAYSRPVSSEYSAITSRARCGTSLTKWVRWSTEPAWKSGWFCTPPVRPGLCTSTSAGTRWRVPFSKALSHCRRQAPRSSSGTQASVASISLPSLSCSIASCVGVEEGSAAWRSRRRRSRLRAARQILPQLEHAALGAEQHFLGHRRALDAPGGIAEELAQQLGLRHQRFGQHVAGGEAVHRVGDRNQRQRAELVGDRGEVGGLLRRCCRTGSCSRRAAAHRRRRGPPSR